MIAGRSKTVVLIKIYSVLYKRDMNFRYRNVLQTTKTMATSHQLAGRIGYNDFTI